jgi:F0F1-type ATP synthase membrane subunit c/vacuolar-type H+-ATPase subunit K
MLAARILMGIAGIAVGTFAVSRLIWWATRRNVLWAMAAGVLAALAMVGAAILIGWIIARAAYGR